MTNQIHIFAVTKTELLYKQMRRNNRKVCISRQTPIQYTQKRSTAHSCIYFLVTQECPRSKGYEHILVGTHQQFRYSKTTNRASRMPKELPQRDLLNRGTVWHPNKTYK